MEMDRHQRLALGALIALFFMWGLITVLNDILIPHLKALFSLDYAQAMLIQFCFFMAYGIMSLPSGRLLQKFGYKRALIVALFIAALGCLLFLPAAAFRSYPLFLLGLFILATGIVLLQVSANPYVALLGRADRASSRLNLAQAFNSLGTTIGPLIGSSLVLAATGSHEAWGLEGLYASLALLLVLISFGIWAVHLPEILPVQYENLQIQIVKHAEEVTQFQLVHFLKTRLHRVWRFPHLFYGVGAIFFYVGGEVAIGSMLVNYLSDSNIGHMSPSDAGTHVAYYWGGAMIGRFVGAALLQKIRTNRLLMIHAVFACALVLLSTFSLGHTAMWAMLAVGLFNSIMFPAIFTLGIAGLGPLTGEGSALLVAAIVGGAIIPELQGILADKIGLHLSFLLPAACYVYIALYAWKGSLPRTTAAAA